MHQIETFAQMMERYRLAQKKADAVGYGNEHDAFGCSDSYATIHAEGIYEAILARYPNELAEWHRIQFLRDANDAPTEHDSPARLEQVNELPDQEY